MTAEHFLYIAWFMSGFLFWVGTNVHDGWPHRWNSAPRVTGWCEVLFFYLPVSVIGGPIWWLVFIVFRTRA